MSVVICVHFSPCEHHLFRSAGSLVRAGQMVAVTVGGAAVVGGAMIAAARSLASVV